MAADVADPWAELPTGGKPGPVLLPLPVEAPGPAMQSTPCTTLAAGWLAGWRHAKSCSVTTLAFGSPAEAVAAARVFTTPLSSFISDAMHIYGNVALTVE